MIGLVVTGNGRSRTRALPIFSEISSFDLLRQVSRRVHAAVQHALDPDFVIGEGVEDDVLAHEHRPVAKSQRIALLSVFRLRPALPQAVVELVEVAVSSSFTERVMAPPRQISRKSASARSLMTSARIKTVPGPPRRALVS